MLIRGVSWVFTAAIRASDALANYVGHGSEFEADQRVVRMGFGRELASALRQMMATRPSRRPKGWRGRLSASHPPARTRVARIEALLRHPAR
jgi:Zn-dependent protease with chaperone function